MASRATLLSTIQKIKDIAKNKYNDKLYDNIMSIFEELNPTEQKILLKGLINVCFIIEDKLVTENKGIEEIKTIVQDTAVNLGSDIKSIETINTIELIKLKAWLIKAGVIGASGLVLLLVLFSSKTDSSGNAALTVIINIINSFKSILSP